MATVSRPILAEQTDQLKLVPVTSQDETKALNEIVKEQRQPYIINSDQRDPRYVTVSSSDIAEARRMFDSHPMMRIAFDMNAKALVDGGLTLRLGKGSTQTFKTNDLFGKTLLVTQNEDYLYILECFYLL